MKRISFNVFINGEDGPKLENVSGYKCSLSKYPEVISALNRTNIFHGRFPELWACTEIETGLQIGEGKTRAEAIRDAESNISRHGMEMLLKCMSQSIYSKGRANNPLEYIGI